ncbi:MAG TPA: SIMPL domain-containing protein [Candidatus Binataceae bacterium]|nr:SIMPL domain-containing protein [Candidatus Binataceae bacterium]
MTVPVELAIGTAPGGVADLPTGRITALAGGLGAEFRSSAMAARPLRTLDVVGTAEWRTTPDRALLSLMIETHALSAHQSAVENTALAVRVIDVLTQQLRGRGRLSLGSCSLYPEYEHPRGREKPVVTGYRAQNSVTVDTAAIATVGALIDTALSAGASRINYLDFALENESRARSEAITRAALDAQLQAVSLSHSLGVRLARVLRAVSETPARAPAPPDAVAAPWRAAEVAILAIVSISYQIE